MQERGVHKSIETEGRSSLHFHDELSTQNFSLGTVLMPGRGRREEVEERIRPIWTFHKRITSSTKLLFRTCSKLMRAPGSVTPLILYISRF